MKSGPLVLTYLAHCPIVFLQIKGSDSYSTPVGNPARVCA